ncbi:hypothetical protein M8C21_015677 [Ambrosia artemisiifolia]|uniref:Uncharacterized protein n=1 Tax=Ambrosia artemisiifolia TaxID=4212 RepID=A0AAD5DEB7_AMBAR|nr:hypothetical protein M8C21_015677 [Ambrosia artemisiifolia]
MSGEDDRTPSSNKDAMVENDGYTDGQLYPQGLYDSVEDSAQKR